VYGTSAVGLIRSRGVDRVTAVAPMFFGALEGISSLVLGRSDCYAQP
jgi:hypothetical protein